MNGPLSHLSTSSLSQQSNIATYIDYAFHWHLSWVHLVILALSHDVFLLISFPPLPLLSLSISIQPACCW